MLANLQKKDPGNCLMQHMQARNAHDPKLQNEEILSVLCCLMLTGRHFHV
jgi:hypothetical protein